MDKLFMKSPPQPIIRDARQYYSSDIFLRTRDISAIDDLLYYLNRTLYQKLYINHTHNGNIHSRTSKGTQQA
jgi:hypothetical protein